MEPDVDPAGVDDPGEVPDDVPPRCDSPNSETESASVMPSFYDGGTGEKTKAKSSKAGKKGIGMKSSKGGKKKRRKQKAPSEEIPSAGSSPSHSSDEHESNDSADAEEVINFLYKVSSNITNLCKNEDQVRTKKNESVHLKKEFKRVLKFIKTNEQKHRQKEEEIKDLKEKIEMYAIKNKEITKCYEEGKKNIQILQGESDKLHNLFDSNQKKEDKWNVERENYLEDIESLKTHIEELEIKVEKKNNEIEGLKRENEHILLKVDNLEKNSKELKNENIEMHENMNGMKKENVKKNIMIDNLKKELEQKKKLDEEYNKDKLLIEKNTEILIDERNYINEELIKTQKLLENQINKNRDLQNCKTNLLEKVDLLEKKQKDQFKKNADLEKKLDDLNKKNKLLINEAKMKENEIANNTSIINALTSGNSKMKVKLDQECFKIKLMQKENKALNINVKSLTYEIQNLLKLTEEIRTKYQNQKKEINDLIVEKEQTKKLIEKIDEGIKKSTESAKKEKMFNINLEKDIKKSTEEKNKLNEEIQSLVKEKEKLIQELSNTSSKVINSTNELINKDGKIGTYLKIINSLKNDLAKEKALYENIKSEKINTNKSLTEIKEKLYTLEERHKIHINELQQIKNKKKNLEAKMGDSMEDKKNAISQCEKLKEQIEKYKSHHEDYKTKQLHDKKTIDQLDLEINDLNTKLKNYEKCVNQNKKEKDLLNNEVKEKNEHIATLKEKLKLLQISHDKLDLDSKNHQQEIKNLNKKVANLKCSSELSNISKEQLSSTKLQINSLKKELINEQNKVKTLSEELEKPINIHRWRNIEGNDPTAFDLIEKLRCVQKKLIEKTEESMKKNSIIQLRTKECEQLQQQLGNLSKQPDVQDVTQIRKKLREKETLIKSLTAEISMYQEQTEKKAKRRA
ncbi:hypothetical protein AK88_04584 [Plasmodium fragile]|uniref:Uncharacterized protein n=1 Tax=Plasmodium fragile TaxID=5857 RepID=A0A0D9QFK8_PLAFR|nr:uncharacterized protein AK88_04584 [Plasmodium fragile]KJP85768.1 hypothetical protein AK88_04584 [Plasmodium fragile]